MSQISWEVNRSRNKRGEKKWAFDINVAMGQSPHWATGTDALVSFFINLDSHPAHSPNDTPEGKQALVWYQAHARVDWHRKLANFKKKAKDLSIHNNVTQAHALHLYTPMHRIYLHVLHSPITHIMRPTRTRMVHT
ncbi:hypothetical protein BGY98DRAFT_1182265 [Russula aff. rugulosa BPL654]|nr:hypothetical protein BGY98DRAFT_1182265 [Russula aff. rugulosa BPL654]